MKIEAFETFRFDGIPFDSKACRESDVRQLESEKKALWVILKEEHTFRVEDELSYSEMDESWSLVCNRVSKLKDKLRKTNE